MNIKPKLVSFKLCPFVQKAVIVLKQKQIDYDIEYIDLAAPPDWFLKISPFGKVPVLIMDEDVIFESSVINEFLEEAFPNKLHPADLIQRAKNRSWIEFSSPCLAASFNLSVAESQQKFDKTLDDLNNRFDQLEAILENQPFFNGDKFSLVDASYAPLFHRLHCMNELNSDMFQPHRHAKINRWKDRLLQEDTVINSTVSNFTELYRELLWTRQGYISTFLDASQYKPVAGKSHY
jgi:glutathione S-transferase